MSIIIGLTGPTGAGKSSATKAAEKLGFQVIDCDLIARQATEKGTDGLKALTKGTITAEEIKIGDVNGDGKFSVMDARKILRFIVGKISSLD